MLKCNIDECNIYRVQKLLKHKWVPIIIFCLNKGISTFNGLINQIEHLSNEQLSKSLKLLIENNVIDYKDSNYCLTTKGIKLNKIIDLMVEF